MPSAAETLQILGGGGGSTAAPAPVGDMQARLDILSGKSSVPEAESQGEESPSTAGDILKTIPSAAVKGVEAAGMWLPNLMNLAGAGSMWTGIKAHDLIADEPASEETKAKLMKAAQPFFYTPEQAGAAVTSGAYNALSDNPLSKEETDALIEKQKPMGGILHDPETTAGKYADTITQFIMGAKTFGARPTGGAPPPTTGEQLQNLKNGVKSFAADQSGVSNLPGAKQIIQAAKPYAGAAISGAASEAAGQTFEGTEGETPARVIAAIAAHQAMPLAGKAMGKINDSLGGMGVGPKDVLVPESSGIPELQGTYQQQIKAAQGVMDKSADAQNLVPSIEKGLQQPQLSKPTLAEITPDQGIAQMQDAMRTNTPEPFQQRLADQNTARAQSLHDMRGQTSTDTLGKFFSEQLQKNDDYRQNLEDTALGRVQKTASKTGGYGNVPTKPGAMTGDAVLDAQAFRKEGVSNAWSFLEPYKQAPADASPVLAMTSDIAKNINRLGGQKFLPVEKEIYSNIVNNWPNARIDFDTLKQLRTTIGEAQRAIGKEYGSESTPMRRLQMLKNSVDEAVENTVNGISAAEAKAVAAGVITPENTLKAKIDAEIRNYQANLQQTEQMRLGGDAGAVSVGSGNVGASSEILSGNAGAKGAANGRPGAVAGSPVVQGPLAQAQKEIDSLNQLKDHLIASIEQKAQLGKTQGGFWRRQSITAAAEDAKHLDNVKGQIAAAEAKISNMKPEGPAFGEQQKQQYEAARGITFKHKTLTNLENSGVVNQDGTIDPKKYDRWYAKNRNMLKSDQELSQSMKDWRRAQAELDETRAARKEAQVKFNKSRAAAFINNDPVKEVGKIFGGNNPQKEFADLARKIKGDKDALEGLRAAVSEYIIKNVAKADMDEMGGRIRNQQSYRDFIAKNGRALKTVYGGQGVQNLEAVAADIRRTQLWNERAKIAGQSNTAKDAIQAAKQGKLSILGKLTNEAMSHGVAGAALAGEVIGGHPVLAGTAALLGKAAHAFKASGLDTVNKIQMEMMMNPEFARLMLKQLAADKVPIPVQRQIAASLTRTAPIAMSVAEQRQQKDQSNDQHIHDQ